jgi:transposase InsO family protein
LRKWWQRYQEHGIDGLKSQSKRPFRSPHAKVNDAHEQMILALRTQRNLGARRIQSELLRQHELSLGLATIHKVLKRHEVKPLIKQRKKSDFIRYTRPLPGDRVQMDTCKIAPNLYQYTSIDDCTRYRVLRLYPRRTASHTLDFIECVVDEMPFPIQRVQTDRGLEFFAIKIQEKLMEKGIKFRPNRPGSPHLNGKVERSQKTDKAEFYSMIDLSAEDLEDQLAEWQHYYNWHRPHSAHHGKSPMEKYFELADQTPYSDEVIKNYNASSERLQEANYKVDLALRKLK